MTESRWKLKILDSQANVPSTAFQWQQPHSTEQKTERRPQSHSAQGDRSTLGQTDGNLYSWLLEALSNPCLSTTCTPSLINMGWLLLSSAYWWGCLRHKGAEEHGATAKWPSPDQVSGVHSPSAQMSRVSLATQLKSQIPCLTHEQMMDLFMGHWGSSSSWGTFSRKKKVSWPFLKGKINNK